MNHYRSIGFYEIATTGDSVVVGVIQSNQFDKFKMILSLVLHNYPDAEMFELPDVFMGIHNPHGYKQGLMLNSKITKDLKNECILLGVLFDEIFDYGIRD